MNYYPHYLGDYAKDTDKLSMLEHGAYRMLLDSYYASYGDMPAAPAELYIVCKAFSAKDRQAVNKVADRYFPVNGDGRRHNHRADEEIQKLVEKSGKAKASAERRWGNAGAPPNAERTDMPTDMRTHSERNASQSQKPETAKASDASHRKSATASPTIPDCPQEKLIELYHELLPTCTRVEKWTPARQAVMRARWRDEAKPNREKHRGYATVEEGLAYWRRFFGWCAESKFLTGNSPGREGGAPFVASLSWLIKAENFAKALEGNYHR